MTQFVPEGFSPLSAWDEYPIHQVVAPVRFVATTDPRAFERYWFTAQPRDGSFLFVLGMGFYPNLGIADAYALLARKDRQVTVRSQRRLTDERADMSVGPVRLDPVRPFAEWRLEVGENAQELRCELSWRDSKRAAFRKMDLSRLPGVPKDIHLQHDWGGYESFGSVQGWIDVDGQRIELAADRVIGSRDHHWGIREGVGGLVLKPRNSGFSHCGQFVEFAEWSLWADQVLYKIGARGRGPAYAEEVDHRVAFDPVTKHMVAAVITNRLSDGAVKTLRYTHAGVTAFLRCAGYAGPDGRATPEGNHHHGQDLGGVTSAHAYDVADPHVRIGIGGFEDHLCFVECDGETTTGIFECCDPAMYNMCAAGVPGYSFLE